MEHVEILIAGAGLTGLSVSYHCGHHRCLIVEADEHPFGHIRSRTVDGFTWDEGPHVSFTRHQYVRDLFEKSVDGALEEYPVQAVNYYRGHWVNHPAQSNLYQVPEPMRSACVESFLSSRPPTGESPPDAADYQQWLRQAFGDVFADEFPAAYTRKYWTLPPEALAVDWVGTRVFQPAVADVVDGASGPLPEQTHYIKTVRYPSTGGYESFAAGLVDGANLSLGDPIVSVDAQQKVVVLSSGRQITYDRLVTTIPLPRFIHMLEQRTDAMRAAADRLVCSELLLVNVTAPHPTRVEGNWFYVYDEDKHATRIHCVEKLSPGNAPTGHTGVQVEVYASRYRPFSATSETIATDVVRELVEMGFIDADEHGNPVEGTRWHTLPIAWANVIFDHHRRDAMQTILQELSPLGYVHEDDELEPTTDWDRACASTALGSLILAGRFGQWKYFWTDDCVLRGREIAESLGLAPDATADTED